MAEGRLEEPSASGQAAPRYTQGENSVQWKQRGESIFRAITLIAVPLLWIGCFYSLLRGNDANMSSYSLLLLMFCMLNADVLIKGEKLPNKVLNILAKINCVLLFIWAIGTVVLLLVK